MRVFDFSKNYSRYLFVVIKPNGQRVKGLPVYETYEEAEAAAKKMTLDKYYSRREFVR